MLVFGCSFSQSVLTDVRVCVTLMSSSSLATRFKRVYCPFLSTLLPRGRSRLSPVVAITAHSIPDDVI